jgi:DNA modification methylase
MTNHQIQYLSPSRLKENPHQVRTHSKAQIDRLAEVIQQVGFLVPIVANTRSEVLAGHGRLAAARRLKLKRIPVIVVEHLSDAEMRAFMLADNKLAEMAGYDEARLAVELSELAPLMEAAGLDFSLTGYEMPEVDRLFGDHCDPEADPADEPASISRVAVSRMDDLWRLGGHRIYCGDARIPSSFKALMLRGCAVMCFTDPPYNVRIASISGRGNTKHREFAQASGELTPEAFTAFLAEVLGLAVQHSIDGAIHFVCMDWRHIQELLAAGKLTYSELKMLVVWAKTNAGMGSFYRSQHELVFVFKAGEGRHINNFGLGQHGRSRSNVWTYAGANTFRAGRMEDLETHPTVKPVAMVADAIRDCSGRGDIVLDPFLGSGTTILAAERVGRRGYGIEIDPLYVDAAIRRWQAYTKKDAILDSTGQTFDEAARDGRHARRGRRA